MAHQRRLTLAMVVADHGTAAGIHIVDGKASHRARASGCSSLFWRDALSTVRVLQWLLHALFVRLRPLDLPSWSWIDSSGRRSNSAGRRGRRYTGILECLHSRSP